jgi:hypothetical protein
MTKSANTNKKFHNSLSDYTDTISITGAAGSDIDWASASSMSDSIVTDLLSTPGYIYTTNNTTVTTGPSWNGTYSITGAGTSSNPLMVNQGGKIDITGENADITMNGKSLKNWMERVEERLNILTVNAELEAEWDELRELGERYRELEKKCKEKGEMWKKLKQLPPGNE